MRDELVADFRPAVEVHGTGKESAVAGDFIYPVGDALVFMVDFHAVAEEGYRCVFGKAVYLPMFDPAQFKVGIRSQRFSGR